MLRSIGTALAKAIRRHNEDGTAIAQYLATTHDRQESDLIADLLQRNADDMRRLQRERAALVRLAEIDQHENRLHRDDRGGHVAINRCLQTIEMAPDATEPAELTPALAGA